MKSLSELTAAPAAIPFTETGDIQLLFMAGLVFLSGLAAVGSVTLLLILAPFLSLAFKRQSPRARSPRARSPRPLAEEDEATPAGRPTSYSSAQRN